MIKVYIAGPMTGHPNLNIEAFAQAENMLRMRGIQPLNPARIILHKEATWTDYMKVTGRLLTEADEVCLLPGWEQSKGARIERYWATSVGLPVNELEWWEKNTGQTASDKQNQEVVS